MKEHALNLNTAKRPVFTLTMMDDAETTLHVKVPDMDMFKEIQSMSSELDALSDDSPEAEDAIYDITARILSCNREGLTVTAEELRGKYKMGLEEVLLVYGSYADFLTDIVKEKN